MEPSPAGPPSHLDPKSRSTTWPGDHPKPATDQRESSGLGLHARASSISGLREKLSTERKSAPMDYGQMVIRTRTYRPNFVAHITNAAVALGADVAWLSNNYIALVMNGQNTAAIVGYHFPINDAAAAVLADDKSASVEVLSCFGIPHVPHILLRFKSRKRLDQEADRVVRLLGFPLVVKPYRGTGGKDVTRVDSQDALVAALIALRARHQALTICPWVDIEHEYRVVMLDDQEQLIFEKSRAAARGTYRTPHREWRHNLKYGSTPAIQVDPGLCGSLAEIARLATRALGLRFASVDIAAAGSRIAVLEINSGVCLERFSSFSAEHFERAGVVYSRALRACAALTGEQARVAARVQDGVLS